MMLFYDTAHRDFFLDKVKQNEFDCYNLSVIYLLSLTDDTRKHFDKIYNINKKEIQPDVLQEPWQTSTSLAITRLAFNLFNGYVGGEAREQEAYKYAVDNLFYHREFTKYFYEAVKIRFELTKSTKDMIVIASALQEYRKKLQSDIFYLGNGEETEESRKLIQMYNDNLEDVENLIKRLVI